MEKYSTENNKKIKFEDIVLNMSIIPITDDMTQEEKRKTILKNNLINLWTNPNKKKVVFKIMFVTMGCVVKFCKIKKIYQ